MIQLSTYSEDNPQLGRTLALEVKTGKYAELERDQRRVMGLVNENENHLVLRANVRFDVNSIAEIGYSTLEPDSSTKAGYRLTPVDI